MLGIDYYKKALTLQKKYAGDKLIENSLQTNGSLRNSLCQGLKMFFEHTDPYMQYMKTCLDNKRSPAWVMKFKR